MMSNSADWSAIRDKALARVDSCAGELNQISQEIWNNPELGYEEHHAHKVLTDYLEKEGFKVDRSFTLETGFRATFGSDNGVNVCVICEYDALPEIGHACGHNLIAEVGIGAGIAIKAGLEMLNGKGGKVTVMGTPAEESGGGKIKMIDAKAFDGVDVAMMAHGFIYSYPALRTMATKQLVITYSGRASHAAAFPWDGKNALDAAVMCYQGISVLRQQMKPDWRVHGIFTKAGEKPNIIPETAELYYYLRAPSTAELEVLTQKVMGCVEGAALQTGCQVEHEFTGGYLEVVTNKGLIGLYEKHAKELGVEFETDTAKTQMAGGSTDMGDVSYVVPSIHPVFGINSNDPIHTRQFRADAGTPAAQGPTLTQAKALALTGLELLQPGNEHLLKSIREEFDATFAKSK